MSTRLYSLPGEDDDGTKIWYLKFRYENENDFFL